MKSKLMLAMCGLVFGLVSATPAQAATKEPGAVVLDVLIGRPACLVATIVGSAVFVVSLPVAATTGEIDVVADVLVVGPARATFVRPLGDFGSMEHYASRPASSKKVVRAPKQEAEKSRRVL